MNYNCALCNKPLLPHQLSSAIDHEGMSEDECLRWLKRTKRRHCPHRKWPHYCDDCLHANAFRTGETEAA